MKTGIKIKQVLIALMNERNSFPENRAEFLSDLQEIVGGNEIILPIPDDTPSDIPALYLQEKDGFEIRISKSRIEIVLLTPAEGDNEDEQDLKDKAIEFTKKVYEYAVKNSYKFKDMGYVINARIELDSVNEQVKKLFDKNNIAVTSIFAFDSDNDISIRNLRRKEYNFDTQQIKVNSIFQLGTDVINLPDNKRLLDLNFDVNTLPEEEKGFNDWQIVEKFLKQVNEDYEGDIKNLLIGITNESDISRDDSGRRGERVRIQYQNS